MWNDFASNFSTALNNHSKRLDKKYIVIDGTWSFDDAHSICRREHRGYVPYVNTVKDFEEISNKIEMPASGVWVQVIDIKIVKTHKLP